MVQKPIVTRQEVTALNYDEEGALTILMPNGELKEDLNLPTATHLAEVATKIKQIIDEGIKDCLVTYQCWGENEQIVAVREAY